MNPAPTTVPRSVPTTVTGVHFTVAFAETQDRTVPAADFTFELSDPGWLIGVDNSDRCRHEPYKSNRRRAFHGLGPATVSAMPEEER